MNHRLSMWSNNRDLWDIDMPLLAPTNPTFHEYNSWLKCHTIDANIYLNRESNHISSLIIYSENDNRFHVLLNSKYKSDALTTEANSSRRIFSEAVCQNDFFEENDIVHSVPNENITNQDQLILIGAPNKILAISDQLFSVITSLEGEESLSDEMKEDITQYITQFMPSFHRLMININEAPIKIRNTSLMDRHLWNTGFRRYNPWIRTIKNNTNVYINTESIHISSLKISIDTIGRIHVQLDSKYDSKELTVEKISSKRLFFKAVCENEFFEIDDIVYFVPLENSSCANDLLLIGEPDEILAILDQLFSVITSLEGEESLSNEMKKDITQYITQFIPLNFRPGSSMTLNQASNQGKEEDDLCEENIKANRR
ncbi:MAG: hypothetical protein ACE365_01550 [Gammaproteobacteria bacterium]